MKKFMFAAILVAIPVLAADDAKPIPQDVQVKMLKEQRTMRSLELQMAQLQAQFQQDQSVLKQVTADLVTDCAGATKAANLDPEKFTCDLDAMTIVPKPEQKADNKKPQ
jgi:hypothetical protein